MGCERARIGEVRLFGSRAKGTSRPDSDVDLGVTIIGKPSEDAFTIYICTADEWRRELTALLGLKAQVEWFDTASPAVFSFCQEASHLIFRRPSQQPTNDR
jgi:predicted nucleotidyltransferase